MRFNRAAAIPGLLTVLLLAACRGTATTPEAAEPSPTSASPEATTAGTPTGGATPTPAAASFEKAFPQLPTFERPIAMVEVPGAQRMLLALQDGQVLSFAMDPAASSVTTVLDHQARTSRDGEEEGLLGLALDPGFTSNGFVYVYYSARGGQRRTVLSRFSTSGAGADLRADPASELTILEVPQPFPNHKGGALAFGPDGMLYLGLGDGGSSGDPRGNGQDLSQNLLGSIIRIDVRGATKAKPYAIPPDNPFAGATDGTKRETWAYGLRNPWRFSFDRETGLFWAGDVGQDSKEEIDVIEKGKNYGWNIMEGNGCFKPESGCPRIGLTLPVVDYGHKGGACSVTGGYVYHGSTLPRLRGWYVYADFCTGAIWAFDTTGAAPGSSPTVTTLRGRGPSVASFAEDLAGELYFLAFDGRIYRLAP